MDAQDIAILTPYSAQAVAISKGLQREGVPGVTVSSITRSQGEVGSGEPSPGARVQWGWASASSPPSPGSEWRYVLVSTVRTCPERDVDQRPTKSWLKKFLGFVVDPNQVNVAITRAQEGLCLIGEGVGLGGAGGCSPGTAQKSWSCSPLPAGDHVLLRCCPLWRRLLDFCAAQQSLVPASQVQVRRGPAVSS